MKRWLFMALILSLLLLKITAAVSYQHQHSAVDDSSSIINHENDDSTTTGILKIPIKKKRISQDTRNELVKRGVLRRRAQTSGLEESDLTNLVDFYEISLELGTPPQQVNALLDTGSSDLWVYGPGVGPPGIKTFDTLKSSTWHDNHTSFHITYVTGAALGKWGTETVGISGATLKQQVMAVVTRGNHLQGVPGLIGIGLMTGEVTAFDSSGAPTGNTYYNVPYQLYRQGFIKSPMYSLYLDDVEAKTGSILFGGIDEAKYTGPLYAIPRIGTEGFFVEISSVTIGDYKTQPLQALLDSGTSLGLLPKSILQKIQQLLSMSFDENNGYYYINNLNSIPDSDVVFDISGAIFKVPLKSLFVKSDYLGQPFPDGQYVFGFMIAEQNSDQLLFGDVFLRNFYVIYDVVYKQIGLAKASFDSKNTKLRVITGNSIPNAVRPTPSSTSQSRASFNGQYYKLRDAIGSSLQGILGSFNRYNIINVENENMAS